MKLILGTLIIFSIIIFELRAQAPMFYTIENEVGRIIPHSSELKQLTNNPLWGTTIEMSKLKLDQNSWDQCNCFSKVGVAFTYYNFQNKDLGNSYNLVMFAEPLLSYKKRMFYSLRGGVGFSYLTKVYDEQTNPKNLFFSSSLSFIMLVKLKVNYQLNAKYTLHTSLNYNHISNGGSKQPNKGMNFPTIGLGVSYHPRAYHLNDMAINNDFKGSFKQYLRLFGTMPEVGGDVAEDKNQRRLLLGLSGGLLYYATHTNAFNLGLEFVNNQAYKERFEQSNSTEDHRTLGIVAGHNFVFGRLTFNQQLGWYIFKNHSVIDSSIFQRYELLYALTNNIQVGTSLKAHGHVAENLDLRIGYLL